MAGLIRTFLIDGEKLNGLVIHLVWSLGTYTEPSDFKKNPNDLNATNILKIMIFKERLKDCTLRKYNFMNLFDVKNDYEYYKELRGTTCV